METASSIDVSLRTKIKISTVMLNLGVVYQWANLVVIPALYDQLTIMYGYSTSQLGLLHTLTTLSMFASLPLYGLLSSYYNRRIIYSISTGLTVALTLALSFCNTYSSLLTVCILQGIAMGSVIPVGRSLIPCYYNLEDRGFYYGMFELSAGLGGVLGAVIGVLSTSAPAGTLYINNSFAGWQLAYLILAALITPLAVMFHFCVIDPNHDVVAKELPEEKFNRLFPGVTTSLLKKEDFYILFKSKMFVALLLQGATGAFPWAGLSFCILWFTKMGIQTPWNILIYAAIGLGAALGGLLGGMLGDFLHKTVSNKYSRIFVAQWSVFNGIPLACVLFLVIPQTVSSQYIYFGFGFVFGLMISWCAGNNGSNESDIFDNNVLPTAFGLQFFVEGSVSAFSPFVVGSVAQFIYQSNLENYDSLNPLEQAESLAQFAKAPLTVCVVAWSLCFLTYIPMYIYYPRESRMLNGNFSHTKPASVAPAVAMTQIDSNNLQRSTAPLATSTTVTATVAA